MLPEFCQHPDLGFKVQSCVPSRHCKQKNCSSAFPEDSDHTVLTNGDFRIFNSGEIEDGAIPWIALFLPPPSPLVQNAGPRFHSL